MKSIGRKRKWSAYDEAFKLNVLEYAESNNNCAAEHNFCMNEKKVQEMWLICLRAMQLAKN